MVLFIGAGSPHHSDFKKDANEDMIKVALSTAAAPTFFQPYRDNGYTFIDGGVWANNPVMIALVDVLSCFSVPRERIKILSIGCGDYPYIVDTPKIEKGGMLSWRDIIEAAMRMQSLNAIGQAGLLIGADKLTRIDAPASEEKIKLDDWTNAAAKLPEHAFNALAEYGEHIAKEFLYKQADTYEPLIQVGSTA